MKLRIQGNSLRFRLTRKEVDLLHRDGRVEGVVSFAPGCVLRYVVEAYQSYPSYGPDSRMRRSASTFHKQRLRSGPTAAK